MHGLAHIEGWILWDTLREREHHWTALAFWYPLRLWSQVTTHSPAKARNASSFQAAFRKRA